jgi:hypothetical protein
MNELDLYLADKCDYCGNLITPSEDAVDWCNRRGEYMHPDCHYESECRCPA